MSKRRYAYSRTARRAAQLLGSQVKQARLERRWSVRELAERAGVSTNTLHKVEQGDPTVALGTAFDVASLLGVPLYYEDYRRLASEVERHRERAALLPQRVHQPEGNLDNEF